MESLAAYLDPGWFGPQVSAYIHLGRVYLTSYVENEAPKAGQTVLAAIPAHLRPGSPVALVLPIRADLTTDACNPALNLPILWAATIHPDGSLVLGTEVPESVNTPPPEAEWFYEDEAGAHPQYTAPFRLAIALGNASWPTAAEPDTPVFSSAAAEVASQFTNAGAEFALHGSRVHLGGGVRAAVDGAEEVLVPLPPGTAIALPPFGEITTALLGGDPLALQVDPGQLFTLGDTINPAGDSPPLRSEFATSRRAGSPPGQVNTSDHTTGGIGVCKIEFSCNLPLEDVECSLALVDAGVSGTLAMSPLLAMCHPQPDFYLVKYGLAVGGGGVGREHGCAYATGVCQGDPIIVATNNVGCLPPPAGPLSVAITAHPPLFHLDGTSVAEPFPGGEGPNYAVSGYLRPPAALYKGDPHDEAAGDSGLLWTPAQATTVGGSGRLSKFLEGDLTMKLEIFPFYARRQVGIRAGELLDLSHTGWEDSGLEIGRLRKGIVKRPAAA